ncbi:hypothetical protein [Friedmanniella luteola]|uniref:hypothetical protein n=1 Tax=Friedmanniella luteola TaxID=546871 RepID=UPI000B081542|nr:hypothetical protein [Friedmanniella luteola]
MTALVLMLDGHDPQDAVALIRERRSPWALCNDDFLDWLLHEAGVVLKHRLHVLAS